MKTIWIVPVILFAACACTPTSGSGGGGGNGNTTTTPTGGGGTVPPPGGGTGSGVPSYPGLGTGTHYWIDGTSGSDANAGSQSSPWRSLDQVENMSFGPGDLIHVMPGVYDVNSSLRLVGLTGTASAWIGLQAEGAVTIRNSALQNVVNIEDCHYLVLKGFAITHDNGGSPYGSWDPVDGVKFQTAPSDNVSIDSCRIYDVGNVGIGSQAPSVQSITVFNCEIDNCYTGIYWGYYEDADKRTAHFGRIANNYIHDCPPVDLDGTGYGIQIKGGCRGNVVEDNVLVNVGGSTRAGIAVYHISTNLASYTDRNILRRNFIRASRNEGIYASEGALIENNVIFDAGTNGIVVTPRNTGGWGVFYGNLVIRHNTIYRIVDPNGAGMYVDGAGFTAPLVLANNLVLVLGGGQNSITGPFGFAGQAVQNFCLGPVSGSGLGAVSLGGTSSVQSVTYGAPGFLYPAAGGLLIDGGSSISISANDYNLTTRSGVADVGAYEAASATNPGSPLSDGFK